MLDKVAEFIEQNIITIFGVLIGAGIACIVIGGIVIIISDDYYTLFLPAIIALSLLGGLVGLFIKNGWFKPMWQKLVAVIKNEGVQDLFLGTIIGGVVGMVIVYTGKHLNWHNSTNLERLIVLVSCVYCVGLMLLIRNHLLWPIIMTIVKSIWWLIKLPFVILWSIISFPINLLRARQRTIRLEAEQEDVGTEWTEADELTETEQTAARPPRWLQVLRYLVLLGIVIATGYALWRLLPYCTGILNTCYALIGLAWAVSIAVGLYKLLFKRKEEGKEKDSTELDYDDKPTLLRSFIRLLLPLTVLALISWPVVRGYEIANASLPGVPEVVFGVLGLIGIVVVGIIAFLLVCFLAFTALEGLTNLYVRN